MFNLIILFYSIILSFFFNQISHPLTMKLILLTQTIFVTLLIGIMSPSFWFSYILFLIFIGGILILFMYTISIIYNEKFNFMKKKLFLLMMMSLLMLFMILLTKNNQLNFSYMLNPELILMNQETFMKMESSNNLNKFFNYPNNMINLMMMIYLMLLLINSVYLTNFFLGPMQNNLYFN